MFKFNSVNFSKEAKIFKKIGLPILGSQLVMYGMTTTDYIMAGLYSANDLAGVGLGASIFNPLYFLTAGVMFGIAPIIAQHFGAKEFDLIKIKTRKFLWVSLLIGAIFSFLLFNAGIIINLLGTEENISRVSLGYLKAVAFGAIPITLYQALRNYSEGITQTKIVFIIGALGFLLNIPLNYIFIFHFGLGGIGCGIATSIISFLGLGTMWLATFILKHYILSKNEEFSYDYKSFEINSKNHSFKTVLNRSNPNFILIDIDADKKFIDINQIRKLISNLNKSSFNTKLFFLYSLLAYLYTLKDNEEHTITSVSYTHLTLPTKRIV